MKNWFEPFFSLNCGLRNKKITRKRFILEYALLQKKLGIVVAVRGAA